jgi:hypothetical protein
MRYIRPYAKDEGRPANGPERITATHLVRLVAQPFGYLAFVVGLLALSGSARLLGDRHELGFFCDRLARTMWSYPEITRRGVRVAWSVWAVLFALALSPLDPLATWWDAVALAGLAALVLWRRLCDWRRAEN